MKPTLDFAEVLFSQEGRVSKCSDRDRVPRELVAHIRSPETIADTGIFCSSATVLRFHRLDPFRHGYISEGDMFALPCLVVKCGV